MIDTKKLASKLKNSVRDEEVSEIYFKLNKLKGELSSYFKFIKPYDFVELIFYIFSLNKTGNFEMGDKILSKLCFVCVVNGQGIHPQIECSECTYNIGYVDCENCGGTGGFTCSDCEGTGEVDCDDCDGSGKVECESCDGTGDNEGESCVDCEGTGKVNCDWCENGQKKCSNCTNGKEECVDCEGNGTVICPNCDGDGEIDSENFEYESEFKLIWNIKASSLLNFNNDIFKKIPSDWQTEEIDNEILNLGTYIFEFEKNIAPFNSFCPFFTKNVEYFFNSLSKNCLDINYEFLYDILSREISDYMNLFSKSNYINLNPNNKK